MILTDIKKRIMETGAELFSKYGIRSISMDDIAKHLSVSKKTIYQHFDDKDTLVKEMMLSKLKQDEKAFIDIERMAENIIEEILLMQKHIEKMLTTVTPSYFYDLQKFYPSTWKLFLDFKENCVLKHILGSLQRGIRQGLIRKDINIQVVTRMRLEEIEMGFNPEIFPPDKFKMLDVQLAMMEHFFYGICTLRGHKLINKYKEIIEEE